MVIIIVTTVILFKVLTVPILRFVRVYYNILQVDTRIKNKDLIRFLYILLLLILMLDYLLPFSSSFCCCSCFFRLRIFSNFNCFSSSDNPPDIGP